jgi:hypothetical protein
MGESEVRCPAQSPASYLAWASWWHTLDRHLDRLATDGTASLDVAVLDRSELWDRFLELVSRLASRAMLTHEGTIEPVLRASRRDFTQAARVARARMTWVREGGQDVPRPDTRVARLSDRLLDAVDQAAIGSRHSVA